MKTTQEIEADPRYQRLVKGRNRLSIVLTIVLCVGYFDFLALIAFDKPLLAAPIGTGVTSIGIVLGLAMILLAILLTAIYVLRANRDYDPIIDALKAEAGE